MESPFESHCLIRSSLCCREPIKEQLERILESQRDLFNDAVERLAQGENTAWESIACCRSRVADGRIEGCRKIGAGANAASSPSLPL